MRERINVNELDSVAAEIGVGGCSSGEKRENESVFRKMVRKV